MNAGNHNTVADLKHEKKNKRSILTCCWYCFGCCSRGVNQIWG